MIKSTSSIKCYIKPTCAILVLFVLLVIFWNFGSPWGRILCRIKMQHYIEQFFAESTIICDSVYYDSQWQSYVLPCADVQSEISFTLWCNPFEERIYSDYTIRKWEADIGHRYSDKYPQYALLPVISMYYPDVPNLASSTYTKDECEHLLSLPITLIVRTKESLTLGISSQLRSFLMDVYSDFCTAEYIEIELYTSDDFLVMRVQDIPGFLGQELSSICRSKQVFSFTLCR